MTNNYIRIAAPGRVHEVIFFDDRQPADVARAVRLAEIARNELATSYGKQVVRMSVWQVPTTAPLPTTMAVIGLSQH